jgi:outer membrane protein assembly factor BamB
VSVPARVRGTQPVYHGPVRGILILVLALGLLGGGGNAGWRWLRPSIHAVPILEPGGALVVLGRSFGGRQGRGHLQLEAEGRRIALRTGLAWSPERITVMDPERAVGDGVLAPGADLRVRVITEQALLPLRLASETVPLVVRASGLPTARHGHQVPVDEDAPWPLFRHDHRNTGWSPLVGHPNGDAPWSFATGKGIFSTPVIDGEGTIYVGSADHVFYAIGRDGRERWRFETGEIIDSAAALLRRDAKGRASVVVPSGDGRLYKLWTTAEGGAAARRAWTFDARVAPGRSFNDWFEGNVAVGPDGTLYAGNTNFSYYAISPEGRLRWVHRTGANAWSMAAFGSDGSIFWGSNDTLVRAVWPDGRLRWKKRTLGMIAASAAVGTDGTVYIGSFDGSLYALDPGTGRTRWRFRTGDHIYASAALGENEAGETDAIYFGSTDGVFYALRPDGQPLWTYQVGDPIRSSAAIGESPDGRGPIVYFGAGNGGLYALHARDGTRRWSFDTTASDPETSDRNDLNGSVALGRGGAVVGSESGHVWYVPYDWCLRAKDPRCETRPTEDVPPREASLVYVTPGGSVQAAPPATLRPASILTFRLSVRENGRPVDARLCNTPFLCRADAIRVRAEPALELEVKRSPEGRHLHVVPRAPLEPGTRYRLRVEADWHMPRMRIGNLALGGRKRGRMVETFGFETARHAPAAPSASVGPEETSAFEWTRAAIPIPTMMPSLNQIGFDYMDWLIGAVHVGAPDARGTQRAVLLAAGARRDASGALAADPSSEFLLPLSGTLRGGDFVLSSRGLTMQVTGIPIPLRRFELRGRFGPGFAVEPGASLLAEADALSIPTFGKWLVLAGLANDVWRELVVSGTFVTRPYAGRESRRPPGVELASLVLARPHRRRDGHVTAILRLAPGAVLPAAERRATILILDPEREEAISLPYASGITTSSDADGNLARVVLHVPAGTELPERLEAIVSIGVYPIGRAPL